MIASQTRRLRWPLLTGEGRLLIHSSCLLKLQSVTGLDFLSALPEEEQDVIEAARAREVWPLVAPPADEWDNGQDDDE